MLVVLKLKV